MKTLDEVIAILAEGIADVEAYDAIDDALYYLREYRSEKAMWEADRKKGKWIDVKPNMYTRKVYCSECGCMALSKVKSEGDVYNPRYTIEFAKSNFCPNCGADMRGE